MVQKLEGMPAPHNKAGASARTLSPRGWQDKNPELWVGGGGVRPEGAKLF
jgi:hypothetical protein